MPTIVQVEGFTLVEIPGFEKRLAAMRAAQKQRGRSRRPKSSLRLHICDDPLDQPHRCRALTGTGERCPQKRRDDNYDFFCRRHNIERRLGDVRVKTLKRIKEILTTIKFRGHIVKFGLKYEFRFPKSRYTYSVNAKKVDDVTVYDWIVAAMRADGLAYARLRCRHGKCGTLFRQVDNTGKLCRKCHLAVCNDCWPEHQDLPSHQTTVSVSREQTFKGIEADLVKDTEPKPLSNDEYMDWVGEITDDHPDLEDWENDLFERKT